MAKIRMLNCWPAPFENWNLKGRNFVLLESGMSQANYLSVRGDYNRFFFLSFSLSSIHWHNDTTIDCSKPCPEGAWRWGRKQGNIFLFFFPSLPSPHHRTWRARSLPWLFVYRSFVSLSRAQLQKKRGNGVSGSSAALLAFFIESVYILCTV